MASQRFIDVFGHTIELSSARWRHVLARHQELKLLQHFIPPTLLQPDAIVRSIYDENVKLYYKFFPDLRHGKYLVVVIHFTHRNEILTAYVTHKIKGGARLWPNG